MHLQNNSPFNKGGRLICAVSLFVSARRSLWDSWPIGTACGRTAGRNWSSGMVVCQRQATIHRQSCAKIDVMDLNCPSKMLEYNNLWEDMTWHLVVMWYICTDYKHVQVRSVKERGYMFYGRTFWHTIFMYHHHMYGTRFVWILPCDRLLYLSLILGIQDGIVWLFSDHYNV